MRRLIQTLLAATALSAAFTLSSRAAHADEIDTYAASMRPFTPVITDWTVEVDHTAIAIQTKPELACSTDVAELARRGRGMADDLYGTAAPEALAAQHARLAGAIDRIALLTGATCGRPFALNAAVAHDMAEARAALVWIRYYTDRPTPSIGIDHPQPDAGN